MSKHYILEDKLHSWVGRDVNGFKIKPVIRNQNELSRIACVHHSLCPLIETVQKSLDPSNVDTVDIRWLLRTFPPPTTTKKLVQELVDHDIHRGSIKASNIESYPFQVNDAKSYDISKGAPQRRENMEKILEHLESKGPVIGSFYPDVDYDPVGDGIYVSKNKPLVRNCPECVWLGGHRVWLMGRKLHVFSILSLMILSSLVGVKMGFAT